MPDTDLTSESMFTGGVSSQLSLASHIAGDPHFGALGQVPSHKHSEVNRQTDSDSARHWRES